MLLLFRSTILSVVVAAGVALPVSAASTPTGPALAQGKPKFLGCAYSSAQTPNFLAYWNQIVPENAGKWGSVEGTRDVMNWSELDAAYNLAKSNGLPFRYHILVWGNQQPAWIESLSSAEQLAEIQQWFAAVAARYPAIDYLEVVNEALHDPPNSPGNGGGNYINALGGAGATGWDWILNAFRMARPLFPNSRLVLNEYSVVNDGNQLANYIAIINLLKAENLVDVVAEQAHSFTVVGPSSTTITNNLNTLAATGLPIMITEMDIDGADSTSGNDTTQLARYQNIFPLFWEHPAVIGMTMWGYRPGLWRANAVLALSDNTERAALGWLRTYISGSNPNLRAYVMTQPAGTSEAAGQNVTFTVGAIGNPAPSFQWQRSTDNGATWANLANDATFNGVTGTTLTVTGVTGAMHGHKFRAVASNTLPSSSNSTAAALTVLTSIATQPVSSSVTAGGSTVLSVVATGGGTLTYQWRLDGVNVAGATTASYTIPSSQRFHGGSYTVVVTGAGGSATSSAATLTINPPAANSARLLNLSTRAQALTGDDVLIPGFVVAGTGNKRLLIRAVGPTLGKPPFNIASVLPDPRMRLLKRNTTTQAFEEIAANDNWGTNANAAEITQTAADLFAFGFNDALESALLMDLAPGEYTLIASGVNNATGLAIVELYDADAGTPGARLVNISNRGFAGVGAQVMIPGFVVSSEGPKTFLLRVVGPTLGSFGVPGTMTDPKLEVFPVGASTPILTNDNWGDNPDAAYVTQIASQVFAFPLAAGSKDAAFVVTLEPGSYTVVGSAADGVSTGVVLVEVYVVQ